jgi:hypothetical protein
MKRADQRAKNWLGLILPAPFMVSVPAIIISVTTIVQRPAMEKSVADLIHCQQVSPVSTDQVAFILNATDQKHASFILSESQKPMSETYRLGSMDLIFSYYLTEKGGWATRGLENLFVRLIRSIPIYILGHALLN